MASSHILRLISSIPGAFVSTALLISVAFADNNSSPTDVPLAHAGWKFRVAAENLPGIDNLALDVGDVLYATQELGKQAGKVIRIDRGVSATLISGLEHPDGLLLRGNFLFIAEETLKGRVLEYDLTSKNMRTLAILSKPEGIDMFPNGDLLVSEDVRNGRLLRVRRTGQNPVQVILENLKRPEGLVIKPDGSIFFAETMTGRVLSYQARRLNVLVDNLNEPDQVEWAADGSLWITEDAKDGRLLRYKNGVLETIVSGLRYPQGMAVGADGAVWLAEQGRQRILVVRPENASQ